MFWRLLNKGNIHKTIEQEIIKKFRKQLVVNKYSIEGHQYNRWKKTNTKYIHNFHPAYPFHNIAINILISILV